MINFLMYYVLATYVVNYFLTLSLLKFYIVSEKPKRVMRAFWLFSPVCWPLTFVSFLFAFMENWVDHIYEFITNLLKVVFFEWGDKDES